MRLPRSPVPLSPMEMPVALASSGSPLPSLGGGKGSLGLCSPGKWDTSKQKEGNKKNGFNKPVVTLMLPSGKGTLRHVLTQETLSGPLKARNLEKKEMVPRSVLPCSIERSLGREPPQRVLEGCPTAQLLLSHTGVLRSARVAPEVPSGSHKAPRTCSSVGVQRFPLCFWRFPGRGACTPLPFPSPLYGHLLARKR